MGKWEQDEVVEKHHGKHHENIDVIPGKEVDDVDSDETTIVWNQPTKESSVERLEYKMKVLMNKKN